MENTHLHVTPIMCRSKYLVLVNGSIPLFLPHSRFELLITALCCRPTKPQGCFMAQDLSVDKINLYKLIERLRNDFCSVLGAETRETFITNPGNGRYRIELEQESVVVDPDMRELVPHDLAPSDVELLLKYYPARSCNVNSASARAFYDSVQSRRSKPGALMPVPPHDNRKGVQANMRIKGHFTTPGILVTDSFAGSLRFWDDVHHYVAQRCPVPVVTDAAQLDTNGMATVVVSNGECLFTRVFNFCYCTPSEFHRHAIEFARAQRDLRSGEDPG